jgi:two-component system nitrogen regulation response regulator NtrX
MALDRPETAAPRGAVVIRHEAKTLQQFKDEAEEAFLRARLDANEWNIAATAKSIETPRSNLYKKMNAYGITREKDGEP